VSLKKLNLGALALMASGFSFASPLEAQGELSAEIGLEARGYSQSPLFPGQARHDASVSLEAEYFYEWGNRSQMLMIEPFLRVDFVDEERTHVDFREFNWQYFSNSWELRVGLRKVFWGVTESLHLVDVINQTDLVENLDGEDKLGQPMVNIAFIQPWGTLELFALPLFRDRTFQGVDGRLRQGVLVNEDNVRFQSGAERHHFDWAARWSHFIGSWDLAVSYFDGTNRDPRFEPVLNASGVPSLNLFYEQMSQLGVEGQFTSGGWLLKFEGLTRDVEAGRYWAFAGGFEYTIPQILGSNADLGILSEYLFDDRGDAATTPFEGDLTFGGRLAFNDVQSSEVLAFVVADVEGDGNLLSVEGSRRVGSDWIVSIETRVFFGATPGDFLYGFRQDDYVGLSIKRYF
jgi:hypothetical protein